MDKHRISEALRELQDDDTKRSDTARLADVIDDVEATLARGVARRHVIDALNQQGFSFTLKKFENALYSLRRKRHRHRANLHPTPAVTPDDTGENLSLRERGHQVADKYMKARKNPIVEALDKQRQKRESGDA